MNYLFGFGGRFDRGDWWTAQILAVSALGLTLVWMGLGLSIAGLTQPAFAAAVERKGLISLAPLLACAWIASAATVKRYHDRDKSGLWCLIAFVPFVGALWQLVECGVLSGTAGRNFYGDGAEDDAAPQSESEQILAARMRFRQEPLPAVAPASDTSDEPETRFLGRARGDAAPVLFGRGR